MAETAVEVLETLVTGPVLPASIAVGLLVLWSLLAICGAVDLDLFDLGTDVGLSTEVHLPHSVASLGAATFDRLNLRNVPLLLWLAIFGFAWWVVSLALWIGFDRGRYEPTLVASGLLTARNLVLAIGITKLATQPMAGWFESSHYRPSTLIGQRCEISSSKADPEFGQAKFRTDAAPLLLNVRTDGSELVKGAPARIVDFDPEKRIYTVTHISSEV